MKKIRTLWRGRLASAAASLWFVASTAAAQDITSNLVAHWMLDDGAGVTAADATANNYDGTLTGNPVWQTSAKLSGGLDFETTDGVDRIDGGTFDLTGSGVTLAAWIKPENGFTDGRVIIKSISNSSTGQLWGLTCDNANIIDFRIQAGGTWDRVEVSGAVSAGHWYHLVGTYDGVTLRLYVDGVQVGSKVHAAGGAVDTNSSSPVTLGDSPVGGRTYDGLLDDVRVYDRTLTPTDVTTLFNNGWGSKYLLLVTQSSGSFTAQEQIRKKHFEDWDYHVSAVWAGDAQATFDSALVGMDVAYVSDQASAISIAYKLRETAVGVVSESQCLTDELGFSASACWNSTSTTSLSIVDNTHHITSGFSTGTLTVFNSTQTAIYLAGTPSAGLNALADVGTTSALGTVDVGATLATTYNSSNVAVGRRVQLPFGIGTFDFDSLNTDGLTIVQRALEWACCGLVGHWQLDESTGTTAVDSSGFGRDGTYIGSTTLGAPGVFGNAATLNGTGTGDYVDLPSTALDGLSTVTVSFWIKTTRTGIQTVLSGAGPTSNNEFIVYFGSHTSLSIYVHGAAVAWATPSIADGEWHHFAVVMDASADEITIYRDTVSLGTQSHGPAGTPLAISATGLVVGQEQDCLGGCFQTSQIVVGDLDDLRIYSEALTATEVALLYGFVGHWKLDETSGGTAADSSPSALDGAYTNGVTLNAAGPYPGEGAVAAEFDGTDDHVDSTLR